MSAADVQALPAESCADSVEEVSDSIWNYPATYLLVSINLIVFACMYAHSPMPALAQPHAWWQVFVAPFDVDTLLLFGGSDAGLVLQGQWYRLLLATFVHVNVLHLFLNVFCLWNLGLFAEPLLGKRGVIAVYLLTGVIGNLASLSVSVFTRTDGIVVGASGAVFGLVGILIVLLSNRNLKVPWKDLSSLRLLVVLFALTNLGLGFITQMPHLPLGLLRFFHLDPASLPKVDNSAHLAGFISGFLVGIPLFPKMLSGKVSYRQRQRVTYIAAALVVCLYAYALSRFAWGKV